MMNNILITTECVADLPNSMLKDSHGDIIYFDVHTDKGVFRDTVEINSQNVIEYMLDGKKIAHSLAPSANDFKKFFAKHLKEYDYVLHICITDKISESFNNASLARAKMGADGSKVFIVDSETVSGGQGLVVKEAIRLRNSGMRIEEIVDNLNKFKKKVSTTFIAYSADYLYYNKKVSSNTMKLCRALSLHPVLQMVNGNMVLKTIYIGNYEKCVKKYVKSVLSKKNKVKKENGIIIFSGCTLELTRLARELVTKRFTFDNVFEQQASATVSSNCGPNTFGVMYVKED